MTKSIFVTLQRGNQISCWRLSLPALAFIATFVAISSAAFGLRPNAPEEPQTFEQARQRIAALQAELERVSTERALTAELLERRLGEAQKRLARLEGQAQALHQLAPTRPAPVRLRHLEEAMTRTERSQWRELADMTETTRQTVTQIETVLAEAGISLAPGTSQDMATGGPFIPLDQALSGPFAAKMAEAAPLLARQASLEAQLPALPLRAPLAGRMEISSGFGARMDPFHGRAAWHSGIDLRNESGGDVLATAGGWVSAAGWNGAYGLMVDIDHGNGLSTRYAHLSRLLIREGDQVEAQQIIALSGASGRAKGAHLHYELRIDGEPTDPRRLLKAGERLGLVQSAGSRQREAAQ